MDILLTPEDLVKRWGVSLSTLEQWRWRSQGPRFFKVGRKIKYRSRDVENFEEQRTRQNTVYKKYGTKDM